MFTLLAAVAASIVLLVFIGFNLENKSDISFGFTVIHDIPVFLTILASFSAGLLSAIPLFLIRRKKKHEIKKALSKNTRSAIDNPKYADSELIRPSKESGGKGQPIQDSEDSDPHAGSYGID